tara:strand:+ start:375 stop:776 length:402 start_codon:yes stop_codon:yes gene_type:complete
MTEKENAMVPRTMSDKDELQKLGEALRLYRKDVLGLSAPEVAERMDIPWGTYTRIERGDAWAHQYQDKLLAVGFTQANQLSDMRIRDEVHDRLTSRLTKHGALHGKLMRQNDSDFRALSRAVNSTREFSNEGE